MFELELLLLRLPPAVALHLSQEEDSHGELTLACQAIEQWHPVR